jgi:putative colanic acid biosynthesis UDP-glucose lipid carrier transferase
MYCTEVKQEKSIRINGTYNPELIRMRDSIKKSVLTEWPLSTRIIKRAMDIFGSTMCIILLLSWLTPILSIIIWIDTKSSPFFIQKRNGRGQKLYYCIKFRTMRYNEQADTQAATTDDERITRFGKFLRISCIDELPQFINVLAGDMSLIGPRPHMISDNKRYESKIEGYNKRHSIKPGITGLAQIKGFKGPIDEEVQIYHRVENDILYAQQFSLLLDFKIACYTLSHIAKELFKL